MERKIVLAAFAATVACVALLAPATLQAQALTREQGDAILNELRQIRSLLERQAPGAAPPQQAAPGVGPVRVSIKGAPSIGGAKAPVTMVAFEDYQCPFCRRFNLQTLPELKKQFIDTGKVRYVVRDLPIDQIHPLARKAAEASHCAADQGKYWPMREKLVANMERLQPEALMGYATEVGVKLDPFRACLDRNVHAGTVQRSAEIAAELNITGTPTFVIGKANGEVVTGIRLVGAQPLGVFEQQLREALGGG